MTKRMLFVVLLALVMVIATPTVAIVYADAPTITINVPQLPIDNLTLAIITFVAILGTMTAAVLGWLDSGEPFNGRKFAASILHAIVAGIIIVVGYSFRSTVDWYDFLLIYLTGAGVDVTLNRITGFIAQKGATTTSSTTPSPPSPPASSSSSQSSGTPASAPSPPTPPAS